MFDNLPQLPPDWNVALKSYLPQNCLDLIDKRLSEGHHPIYPPKHQIFRAFELTPFDKVTVVFLGQDPYHGAMEACGICFGVPDSIKPPPSLKNMIKELKNDLGEDLDSQELLQWARQGVLMINRTLTVYADRPLSHKNFGWDRFLDAVMKALLNQKKGLVFVALGKESEKFFDSYSSIMKPTHRILRFAHPSPLSAYRGFLGSKMFTQINYALSEIGSSPISFGKKS